MSVSSLDKDILKSLENAFDVGKIVNAFDSLIHVINEQGSKLVEQQLRMDEQEEKFSRQQAELLDQINYLSQRAPPSDENRILLDLNQDEPADPAAIVLDPAATVLDPAATVLDPATTVLDPAATALDATIVSDGPEQLSGEAPADILVTDQPKQNKPRKRSEPLVEPIKAFSVHSASSSRKNSSRLNYDISSISELTPIIADQITKQLALQQALVEAKFQELDKRVHDALQELNGVSGMDSSVLTRDLTQDFNKGVDWLHSKAIPRKPSSARIINQMNNRTLSAREVVQHINAGDISVEEVIAQMSAGSEPAKEALEQMKADEVVREIVEQMNNGAIAVPEVVERIHAGVVPVAAVIAQMNAGSAPAKLVIEKLKADDEFVKSVVYQMNTGKLSVPDIIEQILAGIVPVAEVMAQMNAGSIPAKEVIAILKTEKFVKDVLDRMNTGELSVPTVVEQILAGIVPVAEVMAQMNAGSIPAKEVMEKLKAEKIMKDVLDRMNTGELSVPEVVEQILVNIVPVAEVVAQMNAGSIPAKEVMESMKTEKHIELVLDRLDAGELSVSVIVDQINANIVPAEKVVKMMNTGSIPALEAIKEWSKDRFVEELLKQMNAGAIPAQVVVDQIIAGEIPVEQVVQQMNAGSAHAKEVIELLNAQSSSSSPESVIPMDGGELTAGLANKIFWNAPTGTGTANKGIKPLKVPTVAADSNALVPIPRDVLNKINDGNKRISALEEKLTSVTAQLEAIRLDNVKLKLENIENGIMVKKKMKLEKMRRELVDSSEAEDKGTEQRPLEEGKKSAANNIVISGLKSTQSSSKTMFSPKSMPIDQMRAQIMAMANSPKQISYSANDEQSTTTTNTGRPLHSADSIENPFGNRNASPTNLSADASTSSTAPQRAYPTNNTAQPTDGVTASAPSVTKTAHTDNHMTDPLFPTESSDHSNTAASMADSQVLHGSSHSAGQGQGHLLNPQQSVGSSTLDSDIADVINEIAPMLGIQLSSEVHPSAPHQAAVKDEGISYERLQALQEYKKLKVGRRKMNVLNLSMPDGKRQRLVKKLRRRGMLMKLSRSMLEDSKRKYANASLKQRVEYLDIQTTNLQALINKAKEQIKDQYKQIRTLLPIDFYETYDRVASFLDDFDAVGGIDEIAAIPSADRLIAYEENGSLPNPFVKAIKKAVLTDTEKLVYELEKKVKAIKNESVEKNEIASMLNLRTSLLSADSGSLLFDSKQDANQNKLIALIFKCIEHSKLIDSETQGKIVQPSQLDNKGRAYRDVKGGRAADSDDRDDDSDLLVAPGVGKEYVDFKCKEIMDELVTLQKRFNTKTEVSDSLLSRMKAQVGHIEKQSHKILENEEEVREQRKKDNEAVRILQKRFATASIEKVLIVSQSIYLSILPASAPAALLLITHLFVVRSYDHLSILILADRR